MYVYIQNKEVYVYIHTYKTYTDYLPKELTRVGGGRKSSRCSFTIYLFVESLFYSQLLGLVPERERLPQARRSRQASSSMAGTSGASQSLSARAQAAITPRTSCRHTAREHWMSPGSLETRSLSRSL